MAFTSGTETSFYRRRGKRWFDAAASAVLLIFLSPVLLFTVLGVWLVMGRPVFFTQRRPGLHGRLFNVTKFRTMRDARDGSGCVLPHADRLSAFGSFVRSLSFDELPELWLVLIGQMSLVGPRPLLSEYLDRYSPRQRPRHEVRSGITGQAQVRGRNALDWPSRLKLDVKYVEEYSWRPDLWLLSRTLVKAARRDGITQPGEATVRPFSGDQS